MSPHHASVIFSPTRPKDPKTPTLIFTAHDGTISEVPQTPRMTTTSFTFPDAAADTAEQPSVPEHSPTLLNNLDTGSLVKQRHKKNGMEPLPEEVPMLSPANEHSLRPDDNVRIPLNNLKPPAQHQHLPLSADEIGQSAGRSVLVQNLLNRKPGIHQSLSPPVPSPRLHIADTRLSTEDNNYVNTKLSSPYLSSAHSNPKLALAAADAFSNPSYQILNKTVPPHHHNGSN